MSVFEDQFKQIAETTGFIAALDQSGGSTPKALKLYGIEESDYSSDEEMFALVHQMRSRIICSPSFSGDRVIGAILFENTLDREIQGVNSAKFLWESKSVVPFLKVDKGLNDLADGVQTMKPIPELQELLEKASSRHVFGTKMRSVIKENNAIGIGAVVAQQFEVAKQIIAAGLVPIIEPEVDIHTVDKAAAEATLKSEISAQLNSLSDEQNVMLKLTLPEQKGFYSDLIPHANVVKVVALSGGYDRDEANARLRDNPGIIASFSRALTEGLDAKQSDPDFNAQLDKTIQSIFDASVI